MPDDGGAPEPAPVPFQDELERISGIIDTFPDSGTTHIAIISDPFAGQHMLVNEILSRYSLRLSYHPLHSLAGNLDFLSGILDVHDLVLVEGCQYLFRRRIGGFAVLESFLDHLSTTSRLFITGWNRHAWSYLDAVMDIGDYFSDVITLPTLDKNTIKALILSSQSFPVTYVDDIPASQQESEGMVLATAPKVIPLPGTDRTLSIPCPVVRNTTPRERSQEEIEDAVFARITALAQGNYGVAMRVWQESLDESTLHMSRIPQLVCTVNISTDDAFLLGVLLTMDTLGLDELADIVGTDTPVVRSVHRLEKCGLIESTDGRYSISPEALHCVQQYLNRIRMVW